MQELIDQYNVEMQQEKFAMLVAARVNDILAGTATALQYERAGGVMYTREQETLLFADLIARAVCANLNRDELETTGE
jgi:hypothetical protein